jgi:hypothetical protein
VTATAPAPRAEPETGTFAARWPETEFQHLPLPAPRSSKGNKQ